MNKHKVTIKIGNLKEAAKEFIDVWHQVENHHSPKDAPIQKISFENQHLLFKTLTPKRWELLGCLQEQDKMSIRALARILHRDYSNVHQDVKILYQLGLICKDEKNNQYYVPWNTVITEFSFKKKPHPHQDPLFKKYKPKKQQKMD